MLDRTDPDSRREALARLRPRLVSLEGWHGSPSPRPRRSARTSSSGSPRGTTSPSSSRGPTLPPAGAAGWRRRPRRRSPSGSASGSAPSDQRDRARRVDRRRVRVRAARPTRVARRARVAQRPSVAPPALARSGARRAGDRGRRRGDGRHDPRDGEALDAGRSPRRAFPVGPDDEPARCTRAPAVAARLIDDVLARPQLDFVPQAGSRRTPRRSAGGSPPRWFRGRWRSCAGRPRLACTSGVGQGSTGGRSRGRHASDPTGASSRSRSSRRRAAHGLRGMRCATR